MTLADALIVAHCMREADRECLRAIVGDIEPEAFAVNRWQTVGPAWALCDAQAMPVAIFGLSLSSAWLAVAWLVAVDGIAPQTWRELVRHGRKVLASATNPRHEQYRHRVEAHVLATWETARRFAVRFGFAHEGTRRAAGSGGQDLETWAIVGRPKQ